MSEGAARTMASISHVQNEPCNIRRLSAQRYLYSRTKRVALLQPLLAGATAVGGAGCVAVSPEALPWVALAGILVPLINIGVLDPLQDHFRSSAANMQEDFDCHVLGLPWNEVLGGHRPATEDVHEAAKETSGRSETPVENWYPEVVDSLPLHEARVVCQRTNCRWDSKLRHGYRRFILAAMAGVGVFVVVVGFVTEMSLQKFVLAVAAPLSPTLLWAVGEARRQKNAAGALDCLREFVEAFWREILANALTEAVAMSRSRELQNGILLHRRTNPPVLEWIYRRRRQKYEELMRLSAEEMVAQIKQARG